MAPLLFAPPETYDLPLSVGQDVVVDFQNKPGGVLTDYDPGVTVSLVIDTEPQTVAVAVISGHNAVCHVPSSVADVIAKGVRWRCLIQLPGSPVTNLTPINGLTVRYDGKVS